jgi:hypothetical protein
MATVEQVNAAERRFTRARTALRAYLSRPVTERVDVNYKNRLTADCQQAWNEYLLLLCDLVPS